MEILISNAIKLLKDLIAIESFSFNEDKSADRIENWFKSYNIDFKRHKNNVYAFNKYFNKSKPTILLNSHHDTVKPNKGYTNDPFESKVENGKLYGLGSNDAGGALVSLIAVFTYLYNKKELNYNLSILASAEEESSGYNGIGSVIPLIPEIDFAIIGEPTLMKMAIAERGLIVFDLKVKGTASHAAHKNYDNPIIKSIDVLNWINNLKFEKKSNFLGSVKVTVTQIKSGNQHNVVPSELKLVLDVRVNDCYTNKEIYELLKKDAPCEIEPRSLNLNSSMISINHPIVIGGSKINIENYGSPTLSDQAKISFPSIKMGPGDSTRSHTSNEFIYVNEIKNAIPKYLDLLNTII
ncbi:MAG: M20/M25/M40 family metallo-hydrolase [Flavobacteriaceae bacterium]|jgi:acetylornithine deacetylase|nr:M20/M25/M40 family metallo-hydrolase [Flavobacteriaceae bacterium]MBT4246452.1 M20/M25/M40 family metallo-hydrolase [Flavobacteriaceae bacterium]MBT5395329.1 M20/M25/M40 family metallo-hydrolase [Flavobacteriaceae bacterium]MBT5856708.1 M20/M25/M40 family metallo-hydrolase [Flavobacteriaceae bacterium]MBT7555163.1 M20/M25/M40 family metallo-hydrolase [Flavobacteriaceae bacterium]